MHLWDLTLTLILPVFLVRCAVQDTISRASCVCVVFQVMGAGRMKNSRRDVYDFRALKSRFFSWLSCYSLSGVYEFVPSIRSEKVDIALFYLIFPPLEWGLICIKINTRWEHLQILVLSIRLYIFQIATQTLFLILIICMCACCAAGG